MNSVNVVVDYAASGKVHPGPWQPLPYPQYSLYVNGRLCWTVEEVAAALLADADFHALRLAHLFSAPGADMFVTAARLVLPRHALPYVTLLSGGFELAVALDRQGQREAAGRVALLTTALVAVAAVLVLAGGPGNG